MKAFALVCLFLMLQETPSAASPQDFWSEQRRGANCANVSVEPSYWQAAAQAGIEFVRLIPDSWEADERDFLIGNADSFSVLNPVDLAALMKVLDDAHQHDVKVVLGFFSQPGARWRQLNDNLDDYRLWNNNNYHKQAAAFWKQLAAATQAHPAVVGYNPLNEPHPERPHGISDPYSDEARTWFASARGSAADVNAFNERIVTAIRTEAPEMPILLDGPFYSSPGGIQFVQPIDDPAVYYAVHFYGVWTFVTFRVNKGRFRYPDRMPAGGDSTAAWSIQTLRQQIAIVQRWREKHGLSEKRVIVSEFGVDRRVGGAEAFLRDTIAMINEAGYHWAFYAYRGDGAWGGMDYELGTDKLGWEFWKAVERGEDPEDHKKRRDNPLWQVIQDGLRDN